MEANIVKDPAFIACGIESQRFGDQEWLEVDGYRVRVPRFALSSALVMIGSPDGENGDLFNETMGWVVLSPEVPGADNTLALTRLLLRLGLANDQVLFAAHDGNWDFATAVWKELPGSSIVFIADSTNLPDNAFPGELGLSNVYARTVLEVSNRQVLRSRSTFLVAASVRFDELPPVTLIRYRDAELVRGVSGGYRRLYLALAGALAAIAGGGKAGAYISATLTGGHNPPYGGWLASQSGTNAIERMSGIRLHLNSQGLSLHGYDVRQTRPATGWGSRVHTLVIESEKTGFKESFALGALRREVLDTLSGNFSGGTQAYAAFALPGGHPQSIDHIPTGEYSIRVLDEAQEDLLTSGRVSVPVPVARLASATYQISRNEASWSLAISRS